MYTLYTSSDKKLPVMLMWVWQEAIILLEYFEIEAEKILTEVSLL